MMKLKGEIIRQTDKAILFGIEEDIYLSLQGRTCWFPISKIKLPKRQKGTINIYIPNWLYDSNIIVSDDANKSSYTYSIDDEPMNEEID